MSKPFTAKQGEDYNISFDMYVGLNPAEGQARTLSADDDYLNFSDSTLEDAFSFRLIPSHNRCLWLLLLSEADDQKFFDFSNAACQELIKDRFRV